MIGNAWSVTATASSLQLFPTSVFYGELLVIQHTNTCYASSYHGNN